MPHNVRRKQIKTKQSNLRC